MMNSSETANILIVDDERLLLDSYAAMLENNYEVRTAASGGEALTTINERTDVVLLDYRMPESDGTEVLTAIRERGLDCRVVFCSAVVPDVEILSAEPDGYLHKPVRRDELIGAIKTQLEEAERSEQVQEYLRLERLRATLEEAQPQPRLDASPAYQDLLDRLERKKSSDSRSQHTASAT